MLLLMFGCFARPLLSFIFVIGPFLNAEEMTLERFDEIVAAGKVHLDPPKELAIFHSPEAISITIESVKADAKRIRSRERELRSIMSDEGYLIHFQKGALVVDETIITRYDQSTNTYHRWHKRKGSLFAHLVGRPISFPHEIKAQQYEELSELAQKRIKTDAPKGEAFIWSGKSGKNSVLCFTDRSTSNFSAGVTSQLTVIEPTSGKQLLIEHKQGLFVDIEKRRKKLEEQDDELNKLARDVNREIELPEDLYKNHEASITDTRFGIVYTTKKITHKAKKEAWLRHNFPGAYHAFEWRPYSCVVFISIDLTNISVEDRVLHRALFDAAGLDFNNDVTSSSEIKRGEISGTRFEATITGQDNKKYGYYLDFFRNEGTASLIYGYAQRPSESKLKRLAAILDDVKVITPKPSPLEKDELKRNGGLVNTIGLVHYSEGALEKALAAFRVASKSQPENKVFAENVVRALADLDRNDTVIKVFEETPVLEGHRDAQPILATALAKLGQIDKAKSIYAAAFANGLKTESDLLAYLELLISTNDHEAAIALMDSYLERYPNATGQPARWQHQVYGAAGLTKEAAAMAEKMHRLSPNNAELHADYVSALVDDSQGARAIEVGLAYRQRHGSNAYLEYLVAAGHVIEEEFEKAKDVLEAAQKQTPNDPRINAALADVLAQLGRGDLATARTEIEAVKTPAELLQTLNAAPIPEETNDFNSTLLASITGYYYEKGKKSRRTETRRYRVHNLAGAQQLKTLTINFNPTYENAWINKLDVLDSEGKVASSFDLDDCYIRATDESNTQMGTSEVTFFAPVPGLKPGHTIEWIYSIESQAPADEFLFQNALFTYASTTGPHAVFVRGDIDQVAVQTKSGEFQHLKGENWRSWSIATPPVLYLEENLPNVYDFTPCLALSQEDQSWNQVAEEYLELISERTELTPEAKKLAKNLTEGIDSKEERIIKLLSHVQSTLRYQAIEFGPRARIPSATAQTIQSSYGDCKDHSLLAWQLLRAADVDAHLTLISTKSKVFDQLPQLDQFDHMILYVPDLHGGAFIDCTDKTQNLDLRNPPYLQGRSAFILEPTKPRLQEIPRDRAGLHGLETARTIRFDLEQDSVLVSEKTTLTGMYAGQLRGYFATLNPRDRKSALERIVGTNSGVKILSAKYGELETCAGDFTIELEYETRDSLLRDGDTIRGELPQFWEEIYMIARGPADRKMPLELFIGLRSVSEVKVELPDTHVMQQIDWRPIDEKGTISSAKGQATNDKLSYTLTYNSRPGRYAAKDQPALTELAAKSRRSLRPSFILTKK